MCRSGTLPGAFCLTALLIRQEGARKGHERQCGKCFVDKEYGMNRRDTRDGGGQRSRQEDCG